MFTLLANNAADNMIYWNSLLANNAADNMIYWNSSAIL